MKKMGQILLCAVLVLALTVPAFASGLAERYDDISPYKTAGTYPAKEGLLFAGWFANEECDTAYTAEDGCAYAKFVDPNILTVKWQVRDGTKADTASTDLLLYTSVDSLQYQNVGFQIQTRERDLGERVSTSVYKYIGGWTGGQYQEYAPSVFSADSQWFMSYRFNGVGHEDFETPFRVTPFWTTLDGTKVYGTSREFRICDDTGYAMSEMARQSSDIANLRSAFAAARIAQMDQCMNNIRFTDITEDSFSVYYDPQLETFTNTAVAVRQGTPGAAIIADTESLSSMIHYDDGEGNPKVPAAAYLLATFERTDGLFLLKELRFAAKPGDSVDDPILRELKEYTIADRLDKSRQGVDIANLRGAFAAARIAQMDQCIGNEEISDNNSVFWYDPDTGNLVKPGQAGEAASDFYDGVPARHGKATSGTAMADTGDLNGVITYKGTLPTTEKAILVTFIKNDGVYTIANISFQSQAVPVTAVEPVDAPEIPASAEMDDYTFYTLYMMNLFYYAPTFTNQLEKSRQGVDVSNLRFAFADARIAQMDQKVGDTNIDDTHYQFWYDPDSGSLIPATDGNMPNPYGKAHSSNLVADTSGLNAVVSYNSQLPTTDKAILVTYAKYDGTYVIYDISFQSQASALPDTPPVLLP